LNRSRLLLLTIAVLPVVLCSGIAAMFGGWWLARAVAISFLVLFALFGITAAIGRFVLPSRAGSDDQNRSQQK
jgi:hypothetical protein